MTKLPHAIANPIIDLTMLWHAAVLRPPLLRAAANARATQHHLLMSILGQNAATAFGKKHRFDSISNLAEYRTNVPVQTYDRLEPHIRDQQAGISALTHEPPVYYARTSGTTGRSKDIPLTRRALKQTKQAQLQLALSLWRDTKFFKGAILGFASPAIEGHLNNGAPYGSASGSSYRSLSPILAGKFILPPLTYEISDNEAKYRAYALAILATQDITGIVTANPSSILKVVKIILADKHQLLAALASGSSTNLHPEVAKLLPEIIRRGNPQHIRQLQRRLQATGTLHPADIWPRLSAIATWTGGSCGIALTQLRPHLPKPVQIVEYGYGASEFTGTVNIDAKTNLCLPLLTH
ncbi:MAG: GH3 family domain-containing protein, partial [Alphaproteobacteria bacterium]